MRRLGVIGDVHAEHHRLASAIDFLRDEAVDDIVCTGDIVDGLGCPNHCITLLQQEQIKTVRGNHDRWVLQDKARHVANAHLKADLTEQSLNYLENLPTQTTVNTVSGSLMLCHGIGDDDLRKVWPGTERMGVERSKGLDNIIETGEHQFLINGHMHFRTLIHFETLTLINAGTLKGEHWPGFSILDFEAEQINAFEFTDQGIAEVKSQRLQEDHHTIWSDTQAFNGGWDPVRLF